MSFGVKQVETSIAHFVSYLFHPIFLPLVSAFFLMWVNPYLFFAPGSEQGMILMMNIGLNTIVLPLLVFFILKQMKLIENFKLSARKQRALPLLVVIFFFFWTYLVLGKLHAPEAIVAIMLGACIALFASYFVNILFFKVSLHTVGMGALLAVFFFAIPISVFSLKWMIPVILVATGLVATSRLILKEHTPAEIYWGLLLGYVCQYIAFMI